MKTMILTWNGYVDVLDEDGEVTDRELKDFVKVVELDKIANMTTTWNGVKILFLDGTKFENNESTTITYR